MKIELTIADLEYLVEMLMGKLGADPERLLTKLDRDMVIRRRIMRREVDQ